MNDYYDFHCLKIIILKNLSESSINLLKNNI